MGGWEVVGRLADTEREGGRWTRPTSYRTRSGPLAGRDRCSVVHHSMVTVPCSVRRLVCSAVAVPARRCRVASAPLSTVDEDSWKRVRTLEGVLFVGSLASNGGHAGDAAAGVLAGVTGGGAHAPPHGCTCVCQRVLRRGQPRRLLCGRVGAALAGGILRREGKGRGGEKAPMGLEARVVPAAGESEGACTVTYRY